MWARWKVSEGLSIHLLQLAILKRGLELLADGGKLVYSTCSLNPLEGEAVVAAAIRHFGAGSVRLLEIDRAGLLRVAEGGCEGLSSWGVPAPSFGSSGEGEGEGEGGNGPADFTMYARYDDVPDELRRGGGAKDRGTQRGPAAEAQAEAQAPSSVADPATAQRETEAQRDAKTKKKKGGRASLCPTMFSPGGQPGGAEGAESEVSPRLLWYMRRPSSL